MYWIGFFAPVFFLFALIRAYAIRPYSLRQHLLAWENLAAFRGNIFPGGETLPRYGETFSQAGKPCRVPGEHFPRRENLAALRGNIFPSGETLPRSRGTFSLAGKPCHNLFLFAHVRAYAIRPYSFCGKLSTNFSCSLTSERMRYAPTVFAGNFPLTFPIRSHQGVCDTPLQFLRETFHDLFLFAHFKEYAIRPYTYSIIIKALSSENIMPN